MNRIDQTIRKLADKVHNKLAPLLVQFPKASFQQQTEMVSEMQHKILKPLSKVHTRILNETFPRAPLLQIVEQLFGLCNAQCNVQLQVAANWLAGFMDAIKSNKAYLPLDSTQFLQQVIDLCYAKFQPSDSQLARY